MTKNLNDNQKLQQPLPGHESKAKELEAEKEKFQDPKIREAIEKRVNQLKSGQPVTK